MAEQQRVTLADKMRKAREMRVEVGGYVFVVRRPTDVEWYDKIIGTGPISRFIDFVVDWEGVKEADLLNGGDPHPLKFDRQACFEWLSDRADLYGPLIQAINESFDKHTEARGELIKNS